MVLLNANPIDSLENITKIDLVINKGHVLNPDTHSSLITPLDFSSATIKCAYNARDVDAFIATYAGGCRIVPIS